MKDINTSAFDMIEEGIYLAKVKVEWGQFREELMKKDIAKETISTIAKELAIEFIKKEGDSILKELKDKRKEIVEEIINDMAWRI